MEALIFEGPYVRREICVSKPIGLALLLEVNLPFFLCISLFYFVFESNFPSTSPPRGGEGLYLEGRFNGGFVCVTGLGGLYSEGLIFGILRYAKNEYKPC